MASLGGVFVLLSLQIPPDINGDGGSIGARLFPLIGSVSLLVLGFLQAAAGLRGGGGKPGRVERPARVFLLMIVAAVYPWLIVKFGYLFATAAAAPLVMLLFGARGRVVLLLSALLCPAVLHLIFFAVFDNFSPPGEWFDLLDILRGG